MILDTLFFRAPPQLPAQLQWKYANEAELLTWSIRARNYNTFVANIFFIAMSILIVAAAYLGYKPLSKDYETVGLTIYTGLFFIVWLIVPSMTHQKMKFAYRLTKSGIEYCKWKDLPEWQATVFRFLAVAPIVILLLYAAAYPDLQIIALVGSGGMGLACLSMANSKSFRDMHTQYHHYAFKWSEITQLTIATNREVVDLDYIITLEGNDYETRWNLTVYCPKKQKEQVAELMKPFLTPGTPFIRGKVDIII